MRAAIIARLGVNGAGAATESWETVISSAECEPHARVPGSFRHDHQPLNDVEITTPITAAAVLVDALAFHCSSSAACRPATAAASAATASLQACSMPWYPSACAASAAACRASSDSTAAACAAAARFCSAPCVSATRSTRASRSASAAECSASSEPRSASAAALHAYGAGGEQC